MNEQTRTLKIEAIGDFAYRRIKPRIRLSGQWLEKAGFRPGYRVEISSSKPGELSLQLRRNAPSQTIRSKIQPRPFVGRGFYFVWNHRIESLARALFTKQRLNVSCAMIDMQHLNPLWNGTIKNQEIVET